MNLIQNFSSKRDQAAQWKMRQLRAGMKLVGIAAQTLIGKRDINANLLSLRSNRIRQGQLKEALIWQRTR
jgi:hypothetical protein